MDDISAMLDAVTTVLGYLDLLMRALGFMALVAIAGGAIAGVTQALWRFGLALFGKKILIIASEEDYSYIREDLVNSGLIKPRNIEYVSKKYLGKTRDALLLIVVHGVLNSDELKYVVREKSSRCGLIVYCPPEKGRIGQSEMELLSSTSFTALCNFRGRMVSDVLLMMLSTSFKRKDVCFPRK